MKIFKHLLTLFFSGIVVFSTFASGGDTIINAQNEVHLSWYGNYDTVAAFPDGQTSYSDIAMEFTLGKYHCDGYNPSNPGEGAGQTGWCGDWDYDIHIYVETPDSQFVELGEIITPYANSNFPRTPLSWKHSYKFDVTDYYPLLKDSAKIRVQYSGYSGGFTGTVKFHFTAGTPPRNVVNIVPLWEGTKNYGNSAGIIDSLIPTRTLVMPNNAKYAEMKMFITGHGGDNGENCSEFCSKWYQFIVNGASVNQTNIWRNDCGSNFLYPQSGTWVYNRGNWCPGDLVHVNLEKVPTSVAPGDTFTTRLHFQPYTSPNNSAMYKLGAAMFFYGDYNHQIDAGIRAIVSPTDNETYYRSNPTNSKPVIKVKNFGSDPITSIQFQYQVGSGTPQTYNWTGNIPSLETQTLMLDYLPDLTSLTGTQQFKVQIIKVNGVSDEASENNQMTTNFNLTPIWDGGYFYVDLKMSGSIQGYVNKVNWTISDSTGNVLYSRNGTASGMEYKDTVVLQNGRYKLDVNSTYIGWGMNFFSAFSPRGYIRVYNLKTGSRFALPKTDLDNTSLEANFGNGFSQYFTVMNTTAGVHQQAKSNFDLNIYPNPANNVIHLAVNGQKTGVAKVFILNNLGQQVYASTMKNKTKTIQTSVLKGGIYTLIYRSNGQQIVKKIVITR